MVHFKGVTTLIAVWVRKNGFRGKLISLNWSSVVASSVRAHCDSGCDNAPYYRHSLCTCSLLTELSQLLYFCYLYY